MKVIFVLEYATGRAIQYLNLCINYVQIWVPAAEADLNAFFLASLISPQKPTISSTRSPNTIGSRNGPATKNKAKNVQATVNDKICCT